MFTGTTRARAAGAARNVSM